MHAGFHVLEPSQHTLREAQEWKEDGFSRETEAHVRPEVGQGPPQAEMTGKWGKGSAGSLSYYLREDIWCCLSYYTCFQITPEHSLHSEFFPGPSVDPAKPNTSFISHPAVYLCLDCTGWTVNLVQKYIMSSSQRLRMNYFLDSNLNSNRNLEFLY